MSGTTATRGKTLARSVAMKKRASPTSIARAPTTWRRRMGIEPTPSWVLMRLEEVL